MEQNKQSSNHGKEHMVETESSSDFTFIEEKIKERPINKKKLIRKMILTAGAAIVFGAVACVTFLCLEPLFSKTLTNQEAPLEKVTIPEVKEELLEENTSSEEMAIEDMYYDDGDAEQEQTGVEGNRTSEVPVFEVADYQSLHRKMFTLATEVQKSLVTITGNSSDVDWITTGQFSENQTTGLIVGDNGQELLILADGNYMEQASNWRVTFPNGTLLDAQCKRVDAITGLAIYGVELREIERAQLEGTYEVAVIGASYSTGLMGGAVIAVGRPTGTVNSVCYGSITTDSLVETAPDANYQILGTDIYGGEYSNGFLVNLKGQVIGIIHRDYQEPGREQMIYAYGISGVRKLVENMSNGIDTTYMGIYLTDITDAAKIEYGLPQGAYITKVDLNSPAMQVGIIPGDIIVEVEGHVIVGVSNYTVLISEYQPEQTIQVHLMRFNGEDYQDYTVDVRLSSRE